MGTEVKKPDTDKRATGELEYCLYAPATRIYVYGQDENGHAKLGPDATLAKRFPDEAACAEFVKDLPAELQGILIPHGKMG